MTADDGMLLLSAQDAKEDEEETKQVKLEEDKDELEEETKEEDEEETEEEDAKEATGE